MRSDNGESWREHNILDNEDLLELLNEKMVMDANPSVDLNTDRIVRIVTQNVPHFFAVVSRIRQEVHAIGPDGGTVFSMAVPQVQAIFPAHALTKKIRVGLQAQPVDLIGCSKLLGQGVAVSPVVTVEPRRRKFHKAITLTIPAPRTYNEGMVNIPYVEDNNASATSTLRLLCSITGGQNRAVWEDVTGSTPLAFVKDTVSFTTTVSARFWLMDCRNVADAGRMATDLYTFMALVPFVVKFVVFAKRISSTEAKVSVFCMTDDKEDKTLEQQEYFTEIAKSRDVEVLEDQSIYLEFAGNLLPVLKSGEQLSTKFQAFRENRLSFVVHIKNQEEPHARVCFMTEPKVSPGNAPQQPICVLNVSLTHTENYNSNKTPKDSVNGYGQMPQDMINVTIKTVNSTLSGDPEEIQRANIRLLDISNLLGNDWPRLAHQLRIPESDIELIKTEYEVQSSSQQSLMFLRLWLNQEKTRATGNALAEALNKIGRVDIVEQCIFNLETVTDQLERCLAKDQMRSSLSIPTQYYDQNLDDGLNEALNIGIPTCLQIEQINENYQHINGKTE